MAVSNDEHKDFWEGTPVNMQDGNVTLHPNNTLTIQVPDVWGRGLPTLEVTVIMTALGVVFAAEGKFSAILTEEFAAITWSSDDEGMLYRMSQLLMQDLHKQEGENVANDVDDFLKDSGDGG